MNADARIAALRRRLADGGVDALLVTDCVNLRYMTGFEDVFDSSFSGGCLVTPDITRIYTDGRYAEALEEAATGTAWMVRRSRESIYIELCAELLAEGVSRLALESSVPYGRFKFISEQFRGQISVIDQWVEELRQIKEPHEIERIEAAASIGDAAFEYIYGRITPGAREIDLALSLELFIRENGAESVAFEPIVASGSNSSKPHATVSTRRLEEGDLVVIDVGVRLRGYCSDATRTVVVGTASERQREVYAAVLRANEAALAAVRSGPSGADLHRIAMDSLIADGFGDGFVHGLGHGVGLAVHELPSLSPRGRDSVRGGSVVTIEPGVYIPGWGGVRIEDLVVAEEGGCRVLTHAPKELLELS